MIDQMKVHYFKELYHNMKIHNKTGTEDFDKMTKNLKSIPEEDCQEKVKMPSRGHLTQRINSAFGFAMKQFKCASTIRPVRSTQALSLTTRAYSNSRQKSKRKKNKKAISQGSVAKKIYGSTDNIFITRTEDDRDFNEKEEKKDEDNKVEEKKEEGKNQNEKNEENQKDEVTKENGIKETEDKEIQGNKS